MDLHALLNRIVIFLVTQIISNIGYNNPPNMYWKKILASVLFEPVQM